MRQLMSVAAVLLLSSACTALQQLGAIVQPPRFDEAPGRRHEVRLLPPAVDRPLGGAGVRLWTRVTNPNSFGFTLGTLRGTLFLEDSRAATADFPLGLPLEPRGEATFPIDIAIDVEDLPGLANVIRRAVDNEPVDYRFEGTIGVEAGRLGTPTFGPMTILRGTIDGEPRSRGPGVPLRF